MILQEIESSGLDVELSGLFVEFFAPGKDAEQAQLKSLLGQAPTVKHDPLIKQIAEYQRSGVLTKNGLFMALSNLHKQVGSNGHKTEVQEMKQAGEQDMNEQVDPNNLEFSEDDEARLRRKLEKEEVKLREKLLSAEKRLRERMAASKTKRAQRLGLRAEEAQKLAELKGNIRDALQKRKDLVAQIHAWKEEIQAIRPKKSSQNREPLTDEDKQLRVAKRRLAMATKEGNMTLSAEQQGIVTKLQPIVDKQRSARDSARASEKEAAKAARKAARG